MAVSVFHPSVRGGWRDPDPPTATPGVVLSLAKRVDSISSGTDLIPSLRPRIAPHYVTGSVDAYVIGLTIASSGDVVLNVADRNDNSINLTAAARAALTLAVRVGDEELVIPLSGVADTTSPYRFNNTGADDFAVAVETSDPAVVQVALLDSTAGNVSGAEVFDPQPRYIPFAPVVEPLSMFDEAASDAPGLVWRHTRRSVIAPAAPVAIVDASRPEALEFALEPVDPAYVGDGAQAFVTRLDFAALEVRLTVQGSPTDPRSLTSGRTLDLRFLALAVRPRGGGNVRWSVELGGFEPEPGDAPGVYIFRTAVPLIVRSALPVGAAVAVLVDTRSPNVDLGNYQFRRSTSAETDYTIEFLSNAIGVRGTAVLSHRPAADTDIPIAFTSRAVVRGSASLTATPYTGDTPAILPTRVEIREIPATGRFHSRRWIDHTDDFKSLSWTREIGSIGSAAGVVTPRDWPEGVYDGAADPEFVGRAVSQRFLSTGDLALTFPRGDAASHMRPGDVALVDGVTTSPVNVRAEYGVVSRSARGAQSFSLFDGGDVGAASVSGIRVQESGQALSGRLELGGVDVLGVSVDAVTLFSTAIAIDVSGATIPVLQDFVDRHAAFARAGGESWTVPLAGASVTLSRILATIPETDRGNIIRTTSQTVFDLSFALVETENAAGQANVRLSLSRREIILRDGDSLFTAVQPAAPGDADFAGLIARRETTVASTTLPIVLSDLSQRFEVAADRFVSRIRLVTGNRFEVDVQDRYGRAAALSSADVERLSIFARVEETAYRAQLSDGSYASGTYIVGDAAPLIAEIEAEDRVVALLVDTDHYALAASGVALAGADGDWFEVALRPGLVPRSRTVRYSVNLPDVRDALSVFDSAAATALRGQFLDVDPVGDGTVESVSGVLLIQNDTTGFANLSDGTSYIHRLLIAYAAQTGGPNQGLHQIAIIFSETPGAASPATPPDDAALDGLVLAFRFRRGTSSTVIQLTVDTSDAVRDATGEQAIIDHVDLGGWDNASAPDDFDLAVVDPGRGYTAADQTLPETAIPYPRVAFAPSRSVRPWMPRDGAEFRVVQNLWTAQRSAAAIIVHNAVHSALLLAISGAAGSLVSSSVQRTPGTPVRARCVFDSPGLDDLMGDEDWQFTTANGSDVDLQEIIIGPGGSSLVFETGGAFNDADYADLALVVSFGFGSDAAYLTGILLRDFARTSAIQWSISGPAPWRALAAAGLAVRARVAIAFVDVTVAGVDLQTWTWEHAGNAHVGHLPPLSPADRILITEGAVLLNGADPREEPLQISRIVFGGPDNGSPRYLDVSIPTGGVKLTSAMVTWQREIDLRPTFGGWWINPTQTFIPGDRGSQSISLTAQDYSAVLDRRLHGGGGLQSIDGEIPGEFIGRLFAQWQEGLPYASDEGIVELIQSELGGVIDPVFSTEQAGVTRQSWRQVLDAIQERAQGLAGYHVDARKRLVWRDHGIYTGLTLEHGDDYQELEIVEDRSRARNVVDVRTEPESTLLTEADRLFIEDRARIEGGTGRYEIVSDSPEGNAVGTAGARQHAADSLARYPFLYRCVVKSTTDGLHAPYSLLTTLMELVPGDAFRLTGPHLPDLPDVRTSIIGTGVLYVEPARASAALPTAVVPGALIRVSGEVLEVVGKGGPRGSVWCAIPAGVAVAPAASTPATLIERWLCETIDVEVIPGENAGTLTWTLTGMRPRVGPAVGRSQTGYVGRWRELIRGAAR